MIFSWFGRSSRRQNAECTLIGIAIVEEIRQKKLSQLLFAACMVLEVS